MRLQADRISGLVRATLLSPGLLPSPLCSRHLPKMHQKLLLSGPNKGDHQLEDVQIRFRV